MEPWQCIAELIDNALDGYFNATKQWKTENSGPFKIEVRLPSEQEIINGTGEITITDYGPGMMKDLMINAVKAGWSGNDGYDRLGLFGMGFNISTAKLGSKTRVISGTKENPYFEFIDIDPDAMILHQRNNPTEPFFALDGEIKKNIIGMENGSIVKISSLKKDQVLPLVKDKSSLRKKLGRIYSPLMENQDIDIRVYTETSGGNGDRVHRFEHCIWKNDYNTSIRKYKSADYEQIPVKQSFKISLGFDKYCNSCWEWFDNSVIVEDDACPNCNVKQSTLVRERVIEGWIGVQRFFSGTTDSPKNHYGIDLVRNGRVIEELNKEFFEIPIKDGSTRTDYPVEGNFKGRIVGSIEINFCPTEPEKSKFDRKNENWNGMLKAMRGNGLRPRKTEEDHGEFIPTKLSKLVSAWGTAKAELGYSPYKQLIPAKIQFDRDLKPKIDPKTKLPFQKADFQTPIEYAKKFFKGDMEYLNDDIWIKEIYDSDDFDPEKFHGNWKKENGINDKPVSIKCKHGKDPEKCPNCKTKLCRHKKNPLYCEHCNAKSIPIHWISDDELTGEYSLEINGKKAAINVNAYVDIKESINSKNPLKLEKVSATEYSVSYNNDHKMFETFKENPMDYLLIELATSFYLIFGKKTPSSECFAMLKENYCSYQRLDYYTVKLLANDFLKLIRNKVTSWNMNGSNIKEIREWVVEYFIKNHETIEDAENSLESGDFVNIIPPSYLFEHVLTDQIPELCDGKFFQTSLKSATGGSKNYLISEIQSCLRKICYVESRSNKNLDYNALLSIQSAVKQLRSLMKK